MAERMSLMCSPLIRIINRMSSHHASESPHEEKNQEPFELPLIVLSSEGSELSPELLPTSNHRDHPYETVLQPKRQSEYEHKKTVEAMKRLMEEEDLKEQRELEQLRNNPARKQSHPTKLREEQQLRKKFPTYSFLPIHALAAVDRMLERLSTDPKYQVKSKSEAQTKMRQDNRYQLVRVILLARQELKVLPVGKTEDEEKLCDDRATPSLLPFAYGIANKIQSHLYKTLFKKPSHKPGDHYITQVKLIRSQFADRNNIDFRRMILGHRFELEQLAQATEETLMCEKTRQEKEQLKKQLIRQNEKIEPKSPGLAEDEVNEYIPDIPNVHSIRSASELYEEKEQDKVKREKEAQMRKNKLICKQKYAEASKSLKAMRDRLDRLKKNNINNKTLQGITFNANLTF